MDDQKPDRDLHLQYHRPLFSWHDSPEHRAALLRAMEEWCKKRNGGLHRKVKGTSTCIDCAKDLDL